MPSPVISVENLSKAYRIGLAEEIPDTITEAVLGWIKAPVRNWRRLRRLNTFGSLVSSQLSVAESGHSPNNGQVTTDNGQPALRTPNSNGIPHSAFRIPHSEDLIWALRDVTFEVNEGEVVGIIGRNGAGKSTLLKILSRITEPTSGRAVIRGRVSSLLEVGTGFHPELTGRENIYMNGTILGMTKREIDRKFDEIVEFSGVERFLDTPVKRYSSGMQVRLAFSVAAHLEPEILVIDEVLAVGDAAFQAKCLGKMKSVACNGRTVLFVSHNMAAVQSLCSRAVLLSAGLLATQGDVEDCLSAYLNTAVVSGGDIDLRAVERAPGVRSILRTARVLDSASEITRVIPTCSPVTIEIDYATDKMINSPLIGIYCESATGIPVFAAVSTQQLGSLNALPTAGTIRCHFESLPLAPGSYYLTLRCAANRQTLDVLSRAVRIDVVGRDVFGTGRLPPSTKGLLVVGAQWSMRSDTSPVPEASTV